MKFLKYLTLLFILSLALPVFAQDDEDSDLVEFTTEDESFTVSHPEDWVVEWDGEDDPTTLIVANSEEVVTRMDEDDSQIEAGDRVIMFLVAPADFLTILGIEITEETTPEELAETVVNALFSVDEEAPEVGETRLIELDEEREVGAVEVSDEEENLEALLIVDENEGVVTIAYVLAPTGELEDFEEQATEIFASFEVNLTVEDLNELMGLGSE